MFETDLSWNLDGQTVWILGFAPTRLATLWRPLRSVNDCMRWSLLLCWLLWRLHCILGFSGSGDVVIDELAPGNEKQGDRMVVVTLVLLTLIIIIIMMRKMTKMMMKRGREGRWRWWPSPSLPYVCLRRSIWDLEVADLLMIVKPWRWLL